MCLLITVTTLQPRHLSSSFSYRLCFERSIHCYASLIFESSLIMWPTPLSSAIVILASSVLVDAAGYATRDPSFPSCQGFSVVSNETRPLESEDLIISTGVVCNVSGSNFSTPCSVLSGGWPNLQSSITYTNGSRVSDSYAVEYGLWNATGDSKALYGNTIAAVENQTVTFENNTSGNGKSLLCCTAFTRIHYPLTGIHFQA